MPKQDKAPTMTTPKGRFLWPKLDEPDYGNEKFPKEDGEYSTKVIFQADDPAVQAFLAKLAPRHAEAIKLAEKDFAKLKVGTRKQLGGVTENPLFKPVYDEETEEETGEIEMRFSARASGERKKGPKAGTRWTFTPNGFDAGGQRMDPVPAIWNGTVGKLSFRPEPYFVPGTGAAGLRLKLEAFQVIDLVGPGSRSAESFGFEAEDGYEFTADEEDAGPMPSTHADADDDVDDDEGNF